MCVCLPLCPHPVSHSGLRKAILLPYEKKVGSLALGCLLPPSPVLLTAGGEPLEAGLEASHSRRLDHLESRFQM